MKVLFERSIHKAASQRTPYANVYLGSKGNSVGHHYMIIECGS